MAQPLRPEPKFFMLDELYNQGIGYYDSTYFAGKAGVRVRGEKSTSYLESETAARRISSAFPDAKIVVLVRDPIERAISNYRFSCDNGVETLSFERAIAEEAERIERFDRSRFSVSPFAYLSRGRYAEYLSMYERYFPRQQIVVMQMERLVGSDVAVAQVFDALQVQDSVVSDARNRVVNASCHR